jgi:hypothetical protein
MQQIFLVASGFSEGDRSEALKEKIRAGEFKPPAEEGVALNKFNKLFHLPKIFPFISVVGNAFIIDETPEDQSESNLEKVRKKLGFKSVAEMMHYLYQGYRFIIGPSNHAYLGAGKLVRVEMYERSRLELHHPDLTPDYKPHPADGSMRLLRF